MRKRLAIAGLAAGLAGGGVAGFTLTSGGGFAGAGPLAAVQDDTDTNDSSGPEPVGARERGAWVSEALQPLVDAGTITAEQRDAVVQALQDARPERWLSGPGRGHHPRPIVRHGLETAAAALGISADDLRDALLDGQTIAEVAADHGVDAQTVIDAIVAEANEHLDAKVAAGDLTQDEADKRLAEVTERTTTFVHEGLPVRGERPTPES